MSTRRPEPPIPTIPSNYVRMSSRPGTGRRISRPPSPLVQQHLNQETQSQMSNGKYEPSYERVGSYSEDNPSVNHPNLSRNQETQIYRPNMARPPSGAHPNDIYRASPAISQNRPPSVPPQSIYTDRQSQSGGDRRQSSMTDDSMAAARNGYERQPSYETVSAQRLSGPQYVNGGMTVPNYGYDPHLRGPTDTVITNNRDRNSNPVSHAPPGPPMRNAPPNAPGVDVEMLHPSAIVSKAQFARHRVAAHAMASKIPQPQSSTSADERADQRFPADQRNSATFNPNSNNGAQRNTVAQGRPPSAARAQPLPPGALVPSTAVPCPANARAAAAATPGAGPGVPSSITSLLSEYDRLLHLFHSRSAPEPVTDGNYNVSQSNQANPTDSAAGSMNGRQATENGAVDDGQESRLFGTKGLRRATTRRGGNTSDSENRSVPETDEVAKTLIKRLYKGLRVQRATSQELRTALRNARVACQNAAREAAKGAWGAREKRDRDIENIFRNVHGQSVEAAEICREYENEEAGNNSVNSGSDSAENNKTIDAAVEQFHYVDAEDEHHPQDDNFDENDPDQEKSSGRPRLSRPNSAWGDSRDKTPSQSASKPRNQDEVAAVRAQLMYLLSQRERTIASLEAKVEELVRERDSRPRLADAGLADGSGVGKIESNSGGNSGGPNRDGVGTGDVVIGAGSGELGIPAHILAQFYEHYSRLRGDIQSKLNDRVSHLTLGTRVPRQALHLINTLHYGLVHEVAAHATTKTIYNARLLQLERLLRDRDVDIRLARMREEALEQTVREKDAVIRKAEKSLFLTLQRQKTSGAGPAHQ